MVKKLLSSKSAMDSYEHIVRQRVRVKFLLGFVIWQHLASSL